LPNIEAFAPIWQTWIPKMHAGTDVNLPSASHALAPPAILQSRRDAFISAALSLEPRRICMLNIYAQIASARPKPDAFAAS
jgi:hypothetical protein